MGMSAAPAAYRFGPYELRVHSRELRKHGARLKLRPQPFRVLQLLVERAPEIVTREELRQNLWSPDTFVDFEHGLNTSVKELRGVLKDSAAEPKYIETIPRLGYRMVAPVEAEQPAATLAPVHPPRVRDGSMTAVGGSQSSDVPAQGAAHTTTSTLPIARVHPAHWRAAALGVALALIGAFAVSAHWRARPAPATRPSASRLVLAVLPFENLTGDSAQEYLADGLTEELISQLGRIDPNGLAVVARTSVMHYKGTRTPLDQIGRELGVQYVLEGSVRRDAGTLRIAAQLVQVHDQTQVWAHEYDRQLSDLLSLQGEIAQEVADETELTFDDGGRTARRTKAANLTASQYEAYDLYLKGRYLWNQRTRESFARATEIFEEAIRKDPNYAPAYAGLADTYAMQSSYGFGPALEIMPRARAAALKALQLDDTLAEAHASLGFVTESAEWDWPSAEKEFRRAIELNPSYATAHQWYAELLAFQGRFDEALVESDRARSLDPLSLIIVADSGVIDYFARRYGRAIQKFKSVLDLDPDVGRAYEIVDACIQQRQYDDALKYTAQLRRHHRVSDAVAWSWAQEASIYGHMGDAKGAQRALAELAKLKPSWPNEPSAMLSEAYIGSGDKSAALDTLEDAYRKHSTALIALKVDPVYDPLRREPRFQHVLRQVRLAQ